MLGYFMRRKSNTPFFRVITQWSQWISEESPPVPEYTKSEIKKASFVIDSCGPAKNSCFRPQIVLVINVSDEDATNAGFACSAYVE
jgi:hypothetical protein